MNRAVRKLILRAFFQSIDSHSIAFCARTSGEAPDMTADKVEDLWAEEFKDSPFVRELGPRPKFGYPHTDKRDLAERLYA